VELEFRATVARITTLHLGLQRIAAEPAIERVLQVSKVRSLGQQHVAVGYRSMPREHADVWPRMRRDDPIEEALPCAERRPIHAHACPGMHVVVGQIGGEERIELRHPEAGEPGELGGRARHPGAEPYGGGALQHQTPLRQELDLLAIVVAIDRKIAGREHPVLLHRAGHPEDVLDDLRARHQEGNPREPPPQGLHPQEDVRVPVGEHHRLQRPPLPLDEIRDPLAVLVPVARRVDQDPMARVHHQPCVGVEIRVYMPRQRQPLAQVQSLVPGALVGLLVAHRSFL
jgi:hypothetical protein